MKPAPFLARLAPVALLGLLTGCDRAPAADGLRDWSVSDHDQALESQSAQLPRRGDAGGGASGVAALVDLTWRAQCAQCHGPTGRGDGPDGPMVKAKDLTDPAWQQSVTDATLAASITNGKGKMPKFDLSPELVTGLVARVRQLGGK